MIHTYAIETIKELASKASPPYLSAALHEAHLSMCLANEWRRTNCMGPHEGTPAAWAAWQIWVTLLDAAYTAAHKAARVYFAQGDNK